MQNVRCAHCYRIYNLSQCRDVNTQYRDVTIWTAPCCGMRVDDEYQYGALTAGRARKHYTIIEDGEPESVGDIMRRQYLGVHDNIPLHMRRRW